MAGLVFGTVNAPPAEPPYVGLIPTLANTPYLIDDDGATLDNAGNPGSPNGDEPRSRWELGVRYAPEQTCVATGVLDPCGTASKNIPANPSNVEAQPFVVWAGDKCSTFGWSARNYEARALRALLAVESKSISTELWHGTQAIASGWPNAYLANDALADTLSNPNTPVDPATALDVLEQGLGDCSNGQRGVIYCTRQLGSFWSSLGNTIRTVDNKILTYAGTFIIPDAGFDGSSPQGAPRTNGSQWAYATLIPTVRRSTQIQIYPGTFEEAISPSTNSVNTLEFRAERLASVTFPPCCLVAVNVNLPLAAEGGVS